MDTKSIEERLEELKQTFSFYENSIAKVESDFQEEVEKLRSKALEEVNKLTNQREQVRGAYTELYSLLHPEINQTQEKPQEEVKEETTETTMPEPEDNNTISMQTMSVEEAEQVQETETHDTDEKPDTTYKLTPEQIKNLEDTMKTQTNRVYEAQTETSEDKKVKPANVTTIKPRESDIPEYLKDEYNK